MQGNERARIRLVQAPTIPQNRGGEGVAKPRPQEPKPPKFWTNDPSITQAQKRHLDAHDAMLDQRVAAFRKDMAAQRVREEAAWAQENAKYGLPPEATALDLWNFFEAQRKEKAAKGQLPDRTKPAPLIAQKLNVDPAVTLNDEQRTQKDREVGREVNEQLTKEVQDSNAFEAAQFIRTNIWKDNPQYPRSYARWAGKTDVQVKDTGEVINRSGAGVILVHRTGNTIDSLFIGLGYVGNTKHMPEDRETNFTQEELDRGVKVYLLERTTKTQTGEIERYTYAFPYADPKALEKFINYTIDEADDIYHFYTSDATRRGTQQYQAAA